MIKNLFLSALLLILVISVKSQGRISQAAIATSETRVQFASFDHSESGKIYFRIKLSLFESEYERYFFLNLSANNQLFITDKNNSESDSALFFAYSDNRYLIEAKLNQLFSLTKITSESLDEASKLKFLKTSPLYKIKHSNDDQLVISDSPSSNLDCSSAAVSCSGNTYSFPSGTSGSATSTGGYPNYGCLASTPCPAWYYMQVGQAGDINIHISQYSNDDPPVGMDVDFICWGPFNSLTDGCGSGLTSSNIVDCSYSGSYQEDCFIPNAQVGEIYILLITNYSHLPGQITFAQTGGTGVTNCDIVLNCGIIAVTANASACSAATNTYSLSGNIEFVNPPLTGTVTVTDLDAVPVVSQTFSAPFTSPQAYSFPNITCNGSVHTIKASFSDIVDCTITDTYNAPASICPIASITGGGNICDDGAATANILIDVIGVGPFDFTYAFNGIPQTPVTNYSGPIPYVITTAVPGTYTLVSVSNFACPGTVSGNVSVVLDPLPVPVITGSNDLCALSTGNSYSTQPVNKTISGQFRQAVQ